MSNTNTSYDVDGYRGLINRAYLSKHNLDLARICPGAHSNAGGDISIFASSAEQLSYLAGKNTSAFYQLLSSYPSLFKNAYNEIMAMQKSTNTAQRISYSQALLDIQPTLKNKQQ